MLSAEKAHAEAVQKLLFPQSKVMRIPFQRASLLPLLFTTLFMAIFDISPLSGRQLTCDSFKALDDVFRHLPPRLRQYEAAHVPLSRPARGIRLLLDVGEDVALQLELISPDCRQVIEHSSKEDRQVIIEGA